MTTYDIELFNLDTYQCTEELYDFYEKIGWIDPECITSYSKEDIKNHNLTTFLQPYVEKESVDEMPDDMIADFYLTLFYYQPNINGLINASLWLIIELACSQPAYIFPPYIREYFLENGNTALNDCFEKIYNAFKQALKIESKIISWLLTEFMFETFQYGSEWGVYVEPTDKPSITRNVMTVNNARQHDYLCAKLTPENLQKLVSLEPYNRYDFLHGTNA